jgi:hypothetical protein
MKIVWLHFFNDLVLGKANEHLKSPQKARNGSLFPVALVCIRIGPRISMAMHIPNKLLAFSVEVSNLASFSHFLITNSMQQSLSASQEIPSLLLNPKVHYCVHAMRVPVTTAWRAVRLRREETASKCGR